MSSEQKVSVVKEGKQGDIIDTPDNDHEPKQSAVNQKQVDDEKKTNRTFNQSEFDSRLKEEQKKIKDQYRDYNDIKTQLSELKQKEEERKLAEMSEIEQWKTKYDSITTENEELKKSLESEVIKGLRNEILSNNEYSILTRPYKKMVVGNTESEVRESAQQILEEFKKDIEKIKGKSVDFTPPTDLKQEIEKKPEPKTPAMRLKDAVKKVFLDNAFRPSNRED